MKKISVVIATYNRTPLLIELLQSLSKQTLLPRSFEVIVIDDGSKNPVRQKLAKYVWPFDLVIERQTNAGQAAARHRGVCQAKAKVVVIVDDDMLLVPEFLQSHLATHARGATVVLGNIRYTKHFATMPLFERFHAKTIAHYAEQMHSGKLKPRGVHLCTGNVSFTKAAYIKSGGFDPSLLRSEDRELGVRFEKQGETLAHSSDAASINRSDHTSLNVWLKRAFHYGFYDWRIAEKHPDIENADPWRFLFMVNHFSRPLFITAAAAPKLGRALAYASIRTAIALDKRGLERPALAATTLCYGLQYFCGVRVGSGSLQKTYSGFVSYLKKRQGMLECADAN
jgi:glycosyltransferase involved in cell wall biosynthesis